MKAYVISFLIVLALTCWLNGGAEPYSYPVGVAGVKASPFSVKRQAGLITEMNFVDRPRHSAYMTRIDENRADQEADIVDFPLDARN